MKVFFFTICIFLSIPLHSELPPLETFENLDVNQLLGKWFEIARISNDRQMHCTASVIEFSTRPKDADFNILRSCNTIGEFKQDRSRLWIGLNENASKLKIQYTMRSTRFFLFSSNYWIIDLNEEDDYLLIGTPNREFFWILSRSKKMNYELFTELVQRALDMRFNISKIIRVLH